MLICFGGLRDVKNRYANYCRSFWAGKVKLFRETERLLGD
jgi:hypothetical protein